MADTRKTLLIVGGSLGGTAVIVGLVFSLAGWAYRHRGSSLHDGRLRRAVEQHPTVAQITEGLLDEPGTVALATPASEVELRRLVSQWPGARGEEILSKRRRWSAVRLFAVGEMVYVLYFD